MGSDLGGTWLWYLGLILQEIESIKWFLREVRFDLSSTVKVIWWGGLGWVRVVALDTNSRAKLVD